MAYFAATAASALRMMKKKGTSYTLTRTTVTPSVTQPWKKTSTATATTTAWGILDDYRAGERDGETIQVLDRRYVIAASGLGLTPRPGDQLTDGIQAFRVITVHTTRAGDVDVLYTLQVRE